MEKAFSLMIKTALFCNIHEAFVVLLGLSYFYSRSFPSLLFILLSFRVLPPFHFYYFSLAVSLNLFLALLSNNKQNLLFDWFGFFPPLHAPAQL